MAESSLVDDRAPAKDPLDARSDLELIAEINTGDSAAFEALYYRYRDWVLGLAFRFTGSHDAALDVLQETFLYFLKKFPGFRLTANLKTFFFPAVRNLSIAARRKAERYQVSESELRHLEQTAASEPAKIGAEELRTALASLSEEHRETLLLRFVDGLTLEEIGKAMDVPLGTVKSRLHNALSTLRRDPRTKEFFER
jgi:RNA polymerase sigma-70 factor (ECF subfamily)